MLPVTRNAAVSVLAQELCTEAQALGSLCIGNGEPGPPGGPGEGHCGRMETYANTRRGRAALAGLGNSPRLPG